MKSHILFQPPVQTNWCYIISAFFTNWISATVTVIMNLLPVQEEQSQREFSEQRNDSVSLKLLPHKIGMRQRVWEAQRGLSSGCRLIGTTWPAPTGQCLWQSLHIDRTWCTLCNDFFRPVTPGNDVTQCSDARFIERSLITFSWMLIKILLVV